MIYTEEQLLTCLKNRLAWYQTAIKCFKNSETFDYPEGGIARWQGAAQELQNTIGMIEAKDHR